MLIGKKIRLGVLMVGATLAVAHVLAVARARNWLTLKNC